MFRFLILFILFLLDAGTDAMVWTIIEPGLAIVASSLATIRPLLRAMRVRGFESTDHSSDVGGGGVGATSKLSENHPQAAVPSRQRSSSRRSRLSSLRAIAGQYGLDDLGLTTTTIDAVGTKLGDSDKSEVLVIQAAVDEAGLVSWDRRSDDDRSVERIHDLEAQNQENVPSGLGSASERGGN